MDALTPESAKKTVTIVLVTFNDTLKFMELIRQSSILKRLDTTVMLYNKNATRKDVWASQILQWPGRVIEQRLYNVGMDIYGYLTYIVDHYDRLSDFVFIINGGTDTSENKLQRLRYVVKLWPLVQQHGYLDTGKQDVPYEFTHEQHHPNNPANRHPGGPTLTPAVVRPFGAWYERFVGPWSSFEQTGANFTNIFVVRRDRILQHPLALYQEFKKQLKEGGRQSEVAHYIERTFRSLFSQEWPKTT